jgi:outer membrane receptor protein involved in Fe transport
MAPLRDAFAVTPARLAAALLLALPAPLAAAAPTAAAVPVPAPADAATLDAIQVTARRPAPAARRPEAVTRLAPEANAALGATHPNEALARVPGAWVSRGSGQEQLTAIRSPVLAGTGACGAFAMLEDGVPIRPAGLCNVNQLFELDTGSGALEVLRGPGTAVHGSNALHGVINLVPRAIGSGGGIGLELGGADVARLRVALDAPAAPGGDGGVPPRALEARLDAEWVGADSERVDEGYRQRRARLQVAAPDAPGAPRLMLSLADLAQDTAGFVAGDGAWRDDRRFANANPEAWRDARAARLQGRWSFALASGASLDVVPYLRRDQQAFLQHFNPGQPREEADGHSAGLQLAFSRDDARGAWRLGADLERATGDLREVQDRPLTTGTPAQNAIRPEGVHYDYRVRSTQAALSAEREQALGARTALIAGLRAERLAYRHDNRAADGNLRDDGTPCGFGGCLFNRPGDRRDAFDDVAAQLGLRHALGDDWRVVGRLARAFRVPQAGELYRLQRGQDVAALRNEVLEGAELGLRGGGEGWTLALDGYAYRKRAVILRDAQGFTLNDGRTRHRGVELEASRALGRGWRLAGQLAWSDQRYAFDRDAAAGERIVRGNAIDTAPRWLGGLRLAHRGAGGADTELEWVHQGGYWMDAANTAYYGGHDLLHLRHARPLGAGGWRASLRVMNLLDARYAERADLAFGGVRSFPGAGRQWFVGIERRWP